AAARGPLRRVQWLAVPGGYRAADHCFHQRARKAELEQSGKSGNRFSVGNRDKAIALAALRSRRPGYRGENGPASVEGDACLPSGDPAGLLPTPHETSQQKLNMLSQCNTRVRIDRVSAPAGNHNPKKRRPPD